MLVCYVYVSVGVVGYHMQTRLLGTESQKLVCRQTVEQEKTFRGSSMKRVEETERKGIGKLSHKTQNGVKQQLHIDSTTPVNYPRVFELDSRHHCLTKQPTQSK